MTTERLRAMYRERRRRSSIRKKVEQEFRGTWDQVLKAEGRKGEAQLTEEDRTQLMGIVIRGAIVWGLFAEIVSIAALLAVWLLGAWSNDVWGALLWGPMVFVGYFFWKRRSMLDQSAAIWGAHLDRLVDEEVERRIGELEEKGGVPHHATAEDEQIVQAYGTARMRCENRMFADIRELPAPKVRIKYALLRAIHMETDYRLRETLKSGYLGLADFQEAIGVGSGGVVNPGMSPEEVLRELPSPELLNRVAAERSVLAEELKSLGLWGGTGKEKTEQ